MKKRIKKIISTVKRRKKLPELSGAITNETVAEHRETILAGGKRFKYPVQYSRHKLVINSIIISVGTLVVAGVLLWLQFYVFQNSSQFIYRVSQLIPLPVAVIDGEQVPYSMYLKRFRSSIHYLQDQNNLNPDTNEGKKEIEYRKRVELDNAIRDAYATKLAKEYKVTVSEGDVSEFIRKDLQSKKVSDSTYEKTVLNAFYDWSMDDYRGIVRAELLKRKVSFAVDDTARQKSERVLAALRAPAADFGAIAKAESDDEATKANGGDSGDVPLKTLDSNGVIAKVQSLQPGQVTELIYGTDGYYVAKLTSKSDQAVRFQFIKIALHEFESRLAAAKKAGKVKEYIAVAQLGQ
ncbi:MAG: peptidylprolyl isomerase [Candidatus Saccharimonadales bacterium]